MAASAGLLQPKRGYVAQDITQGLLRFDEQDETTQDATAHAARGEVALTHPNESSDPHAVTEALPSTSGDATLVLCANCGSRNTHRFGTFDVTICDLPQAGRPTKFKRKRQRYICRSCGSTFHERHPDLDDDRAATVRLVRYVEAEALRRSFTSIAADVGLDESTVRRIFKDFVRRLDLEASWPSPEAIGLHRTTINKTPRLLITDQPREALLDVLPSTEDHMLEQRLAALSTGSPIHTIVTFPSDSYRGLITIVLPDAVIVVDPGYMLEQAILLVEQARRLLRQFLSASDQRSWTRHGGLLLKRRKELLPRDAAKLDSWYARFSWLADVYAYKEALFSLYEAEDKTTAETSMSGLLASHIRASPEGVPPDALPAFINLRRVLDAWQHETLAYFDASLSRGPEAIRRRAVPAFYELPGVSSFEAIRGILLYGSIFPDSSHAQAEARKANSSLHLPPHTSAAPFLNQVFVERSHASL